MNIYIFENVHTVVLRNGDLLLCAMVFEPGRANDIRGTVQIYGDKHTIYKVQIHTVFGFEEIKKIQNFLDAEGERLWTEQLKQML